MSWGQPTGVTALMKRGIELGRELKGHEDDKATVEKAIKQLERQGKRPDPIDETRRQGELTNERNLLREIERKLNAKKREVEANDRKLADAVRERETLSKRKGQAINELKRIADDMRSQAHRENFSGVRGLASKASNLATELERIEGKLKAAS
jgi:chromosome segregation ATPase